MFKTCFSIIISLISLFFSTEAAIVVNKNDLKAKIEDFLNSETHQDAKAAVKESLPAVVLIHIFDDSVKDNGKIYNAAFQDKKRHNHYVTNGIIIHESGYIVTTCDTFKKSSRIIVSINSENRTNSTDASMIITKDDYEAKIIKKIPELNIVVLKIDSKNDDIFPHLELANIGKLKNSKDLLLRCSFMIGKARGDFFITSTNQFVTKNNFTVIAYPSEKVCMEKIGGVEYLAVTNRLMQFGSFCENAGGALIDYTGRCLGVIDYNASEEELQVKTIVIPCDVVRKALEIAVPSLRKYQKAIDLGVTFSKTSDGKVCIETVEKDSSADRCGLKQGDILLKLNNENITTPDVVKNMLNRAVGDGSVAFTIMRRDTTTEIEITG